ncbi:hypothetical protein OESDEN_05710 [Oesophagostomum dentatum]|uniref:Dynamin-like GTPase OPA1 C-terminal domain-containing protein n=1 Tax=Oesophagostomum dentatum TaxID=61180 RepID=A0A0B1TAR1_OESDE|nr:hypothetical protein OESDEN_05710 [Oesophagostomum dentatum]
MEDRAVPDRKSWDSACHFMGQVDTRIFDAQQRNPIRLIQTAANRLAMVNKQLNDARGPGWVSRWIFWQTPSADNHFASAVQDELAAMLSGDPEHKQALTDEDILVVRRNLETKGVIEVPSETIRRQWNLMYKKHFLERTIQTSRDCPSLYQHYRQGFNEGDVDCQTVVFFYRCFLIQRMLKLTCNALRQQITNTEQRRLEKEVKDVLDDWSQEADKKQKYLTGRRVDLAEELKQVRRIQEKLEEFMVQLQREK